MAKFVSNPWPDSLDLVATVVFLAIAIGLPLVGYVFMAIDFRAYLRTLKRGLITMAQSIYELPEWARRETPPAIAALGLRLPCSEDDLKRAYRKRVKRLHPDHGGDERRFLQLQAQFEEALSIVAGLSADEASH